MTRLIDADALKEAIGDAYEGYDGYDPHDLSRFAELVDDLIDNAPTAEPEKIYLAKINFDKEQLQEIVDKAKTEILASAERPQGKWIKQEWGYVCSVCGESNDYAYDNNIHKFTDNFCPNCGADMREEADNDTVN